jgi:hypothetical protein
MDQRSSGLPNVQSAEDEALYEAAAIERRIRSLHEALGALRAIEAGSKTADYAGTRAGLKHAVEEQTKKLMELKKNY